MSDDLEDLKGMFRAEAPIEAPPAARDAAIAAAMARFAAENARLRQGSGLGARLTRRAGALLHKMRDKRPMPSIRLNQALLAGASLAALTLVVVNTGLLRESWPEFGTARREAIAPPPPAPREEKRELADALDAEAPVAAPEPAVKKDMGRIAARRKSAAEGTAAVRPVPGSSTLSESRDAGGQVLLNARPAPDRTALGYRDQGRDRFKDIAPNPVKLAREEPVSTFSIDVDTASYGFVRAALNNGTLPQQDAVRVEELINYFPYDYAGPTDRSEPFKATATVFPTPWNPDSKLLHIGIKGYTLDGRERPRSNLVFLIDTSGSMDDPAKLPLLRNALKLLVETMGPEDTISIVTYAGSAGTVLEPTRAADKAKIIAALDNLQPQGSTAGAEGIRQAYQLAERSFDESGVNRVILATDGDFNVGITDPRELKSFVERKRQSGIHLSVLGFGRGNYNDELMQELAQNGNGHAAYIDTLNEARKVLVEEASSTLFPIAKDVKIQVEYNPQTVAEYRLIGYETRLLQREDFNNDKVDAGDIGAGHSVTAIYEITPRESKARLVDDLRYAAPQTQGAGSGEYAFLKLRYKLPESSTSKLIETPVGAGQEVREIAQAPVDVRFAAAVAGFGQILRGGQYTRNYSLDDVIALAQASKGEDPFGYRAEFINLARLAKTAQALEPLTP